MVSLAALRMALYILTRPTLRQDTIILSFHITFWGFLGRAVEKNISYQEKITQYIHIYTYSVKTKKWLLLTLKNNKINTWCNL